eukprot:GHVP01041979.1.p1 GENE.GHVP01041979.1~~GHVP01041979.1.p1  ORF type:complete len:784 (+),score=132.45 GHVP01041979.1:876-3227(+)
MLLDIRHSQIEEEQPLIPLNSTYSNESSPLRKTATFIWEMFSGACSGLQQTIRGLFATNFASQVPENFGDVPDNDNLDQENLEDSSNLSSHSITHKLTLFPGANFRLLPFDQNVNPRQQIPCEFGIMRETESLDNNLKKLALSYKNVVGNPNVIKNLGNVLGLVLQNLSPISRFKLVTALDVDYPFYCTLAVPRLKEHKVKKKKDGTVCKIVNELDEGMTSVVFMDETKKEALFFKKSFKKFQHVEFVAPILNNEVSDFLAKLSNNLISLDLTCVDSEDLKYRQDFEKIELKKLKHLVVDFNKFKIFLSNLWCPNIKSFECSKIGVTERIFLINHLELIENLKFIASEFGRNDISYLKSLKNLYMEVENQSKLGLQLSECLPYIPNQLEHFAIEFKDKNGAEKTLRFLRSFAFCRIQEWLCTRWYHSSIERDNNIPKRKDALGRLLESKIEKNEIKMTFIFQSAFTSLFVDRNVTFFDDLFWFSEGTENYKKLHDWFVTPPTESNPEFSAMPGSAPKRAELELEPTYGHLVLRELLKRNVSVRFAGSLQTISKVIEALNVDKFKIKIYNGILSLCSAKNIRSSLDQEGKNFNDFLKRLLSNRRQQDGLNLVAHGHRDSELYFNFHPTTLKFRTLIVLPEKMNCHILEVCKDLRENNKNKHFYFKMIFLPMSNSEISKEDIDGNIFVSPGLREFQINDLSKNLEKCLQSKHSLDFLIKDILRLVFLNQQFATSFHSKCSATYFLTIKEIAIRYFALKCVLMTIRSINMIIKDKNSVYEIFFILD